MRGLDKTFLKDLKTGLLKPVLTRVRSDQSINLEIRENYISLYYRGGMLLKLESNNGKYIASNDNIFIQDAIKKMGLYIPNKNISSIVDINNWVEMFKNIKHAIDMNFNYISRFESEAQQLIVRENNLGNIGKATDYFICDIEYVVHDEAAFDMIAVQWPSTSQDRQNTADRRLVFIEIKYGDNAITGSSGIKKHVNDIEDFINDSTKLNDLKSEMVNLFNQKLELGLRNNINKLTCF